MGLFKYKYRVLTKTNEIKDGIVSALTQKRAERRLVKEGSEVLFVTPFSTKKMSWKEHFPSLSRFSKIQQIAFFRNFAAMLGAGISLSEALSITKEQVKSVAMQRVIEEMIKEIENGMTLSDAMKKYPRYFNDFMIETVLSGEVTGRLAKSLERIADELDREHELMREIKSHMAYPAVVVVVIFAVLVILSVYVLPKVADVFTDLGVQLPFFTRILLVSGVFITTYYLELGIALAIALTAAMFVVRTPKGRYVYHYLWLHAPLFGGLTKETALAHFFRVLESLFASDISLVRSVDIAKRTLNNDVYKRALAGVYPQLLHGVPLSEALQTLPALFPLQARKMIQVGERVGRLDESFAHVANHFERSLRYKTKSLTAMIEPVLIVFVGLIVGGVALSIFLPLYQELPNAIQ